MGWGYNFGWNAESELPKKKPQTMKSKNRRRESAPPIAGTCKLFTIISSSVICLVVSLLLAITDPVLIIAKYNMRLAHNSTVYNLMLQELEPIHVSTYLFNVTNADRFLAGDDEKLKVEEVGPFTYREIRHNLDLELDSDEGVMRYTPKVNLSFIPEESIGDPKDYNVTMPNVAMLSMSSMMTSYSFLLRSGFNILVDRINAKPIINLSAFDYLWGYDDPLISAGNTYMPGWIYFNTLGILDRMYDVKNNHAMEVGATDADKFEIKAMDRLKGLKVHGYDDPSQRTKCNSFINTYEGISYPTDLTPERPIRIFRTTLCRFLELEYVGSRLMDYGGDAMLLKLKNNTFSTKEEDNKCLCSHDICIDGISDISPCFYGLPLAISNAHFTGASPELRDRLEGVTPNATRFSTSFVIEPNLGLELQTEFSIQLNVVVGDTWFSPRAARFADMVVPVAYFTITQPKLPQETKDILHLIHVIAPGILLGVEILLLLTGLGLLAYSAWLLYWNWLSSEGKGMAFQITSEGKKSVILGVDIELPLVSEVR